MSEADGNVPPPAESPVMGKETAPLTIVEATPRLTKAGLPDKRQKGYDHKRRSLGYTAGPGLPKGTPLPTKRTYSKQDLAQKVIQSIVTGKISKETSALPLTDTDKRILARIASLNVEQFNEYIAQDLREISALSAQCIKEALVERRFKPGELGFIHSVAHDKRTSLDGSRALHSSSINVQVNNYGPLPKDSLLSELDGLSHTKNITPHQKAS